MTLDAGPMCGRCYRRGLHAPSCPLGPAPAAPGLAPDQPVPTPKVDA